MRRKALWLAVLASAYFVAAITVYRFRHPELTQTQLFMAIPEALKWA